MNAGDCPRCGYPGDRWFGETCDRHGKGGPPSLVEQHARKRRMEERAERMYDLLVELESGGENCSCPSCGHVHDGHSDGCKLDALFKEIEGT